MKNHESWWETNLDADKYVHDNVLYDAPSKETFEVWMGDHNAEDRIKVRSLMVPYESVLDAGCGAAPEHRVIPPEKYWAMDITPKLVNYNADRGIRCVQGSLMDIPFSNDSFDIVINRHVVEHMAEVETPLKELLRVAKKQLLISFFIDPIDLDWHRIKLDNPDTDGAIYHNQYSQRIIEAILKLHPKVSSWKWESGAGKTTRILDVRMK